MRDKDTSSRNRSKLAAKITVFGVQEGKKEYSKRASTNDLKCFLEKEGFSRDMIRRAVSISARHLSTKDYEGIVKVVKQIPLMYFEPEPQAGGSNEASVARPATTPPT